jgi:uncharacterized membrane protein
MKEKALLYVAIFLTVASIAYWTAYGFNAFYTFHEYNDLGIFAYNMWYDLHFPGIVHGLQLLIFGNHISPDQLLLVLPFFAIDQSPLTLLFIQAVVLSLTSLLVYFIAKDLLKDNVLAFLLFLAFLVNPGMHGMLIFDYHAEMLIIPFVLLTFYFFMKSNAKLFYISLLFLLGTIEEAPFIAVALLFGLLVYVLSYVDKSARRSLLIMLGIGFIVSFVVFGIYHIITASLISSYATNYPDLPPMLKANIYYSNLLGGAVSGLTNIGKVANNTSLLLSSSMSIYIFYGIIVAFFAAGIAILFDPLIALLMGFPWLVEIFVNQNLGFIVIWNQYFSFVLGGTFAASILGLMLMKERKGVLAKLIAKYRKEDYEMFISKLVYSLISFMIFLFIITYPLFIYSKNVNNISQDLLFQVSPQIRAIDEQLYSVMALVPENSSLMTDYFIMAHFTNMRYLEEFGNSTIYFVPKYILFDFNLNISLNGYSSVPFLLQYLQTHRYTLYARNGTAYLLVLSNSTA